MAQPSLSEVLTRALHFGFDESGWHPALEQALEGISAEQAAWKPAPERNSIRELVRHLTHWKKAALDGFMALASREAFLAYSAQDWQEPPAEASWEADRDELRRISRELLERVASCEAATLLSPPEGGRSPRLWNLLNLATHDAYHAGQIVYLRRLQGI